MGEEMKKMIKYVICVVAVSSIVLLLCIGAFSKEEILVSSNSPDGNHNIIIRYKEPLLSKENCNVYIYYNGENMRTRKKILSTEIKNNGEDLGEENYSIVWRGNEQVDIELKGKELRGRKVQILIHDGGKNIGVITSN